MWELSAYIKADQAAMILSAKCLHIIHTQHMYSIFIFMLSKQLIIAVNLEIIATCSPPGPVRPLVVTKTSRLRTMLPEGVLS